MSCAVQCPLNTRWTRRQCNVGAPLAPSPKAKSGISCPNSESWLRPVFGLSWINWHVPFHISHFSANTLRSLLEECGFTLRENPADDSALWVASFPCGAAVCRGGEAHPAAAESAIDVRSGRAVPGSAVSPRSPRKPVGPGRLPGRGGDEGRRSSGSRLSLRPVAWRSGFRRPQV